MNGIVQIIGCGYVGLTTAVALYHRGIRATGIEIDDEKRASISSGRIPFHEPGVSELLLECQQKGFEVRDSLIDADITFIAVGTPCNEDGSISLSYVESASRMLGNFLKDHDGYHLVVVKSTVVPGTTNGIVKNTIEDASGKLVGRDIGLCMNPEFLREGSALNDVLDPDRIVIGEYDVKSGDSLYSLYQSFYSDKMPPMLRTSLTNAEFIKYASNAFLATKISFINTIANIAQRVPDADVVEIAKGMGFDQRIGNKFLSAGLGYGGSCFPKDLKAIISFAKSAGYNPLLLEDVEDVNGRQLLVAIGQARKALDGLKGKMITLLGLAFKPDSDDIREAVSVRMIERLLDEGARIKVYDPIASQNMTRKFASGKVTYAESAIEALKGSDCCFIVTEWDEFRKLSPEDYAKNMRTSVIIDGRRIYDPKQFVGKVTDFFAIGLGTSQYRMHSINSWREPALAVNVILTDSQDRVLLVRRNHDPFRGVMSLPGGFVEYDESVERTIQRELSEEIGVKVTSSELLAVYSDPARSPEKHVVALLYRVFYDGEPRLIDRDELMDLGFYDPKNIPEDLAFDHSKMLQDYLSREEE